LGQSQGALWAPVFAKAILAQIAHAYLRLPICYLVHGLTREPVSVSPDHASARSAKVGTGFAEAIKLAQIAYTYLRLTR
jgi:hypothetical protein